MSNEKSNGKRIHYLSLMSVVSALAVVMLHTNGCFWDFSTEPYWVTANVIESVMYFAVPVFFMVSGATLIDYRKRYTLKEYAKKRFDKAVIPFLAWSLIGALYFYLTGGLELYLTLDSLKNLVLGVLNVQYVSIFWFFIALFQAYLCIPLFACVEKESRISIYTYVIGAAFVFNSLIPFVNNVFQLGYYNYISVGVGSGYLIFVLLGYVLHNVSLSPKQRYLTYALSVVGLLMHIIGTYTLSMQAGTVITTYKEYTNVPSILYSVGIFVFLKEIGSKLENEKLITVIETLGKYTFAVYLMHWFIMDIMNRLFIIDGASLVYRIGAPILIYAICMAIAWVIRKIPVLKHIVP